MIILKMKSCYECLCLEKVAYGRTVKHGGVNLKGRGFDPMVLTFCHFFYKKT